MMSLLLVCPEFTVMYHGAANCVVCPLLSYCILLLLTIIIFYNYPMVHSQVPKVGDDAAAVDVVGELPSVEILTGCGILGGVY